MAGATGLDYAGVVAYLDEEQRHGRLRRGERAGVWVAVRAAEAAVLQVWAEQRNKREQHKS